MENSQKQKTGLPLDNIPNKVIKRSELDQNDSVNESGISLVSHTNLNQNMTPKFLSSFNHDLSTAKNKSLFFPFEDKKNKKKAKMEVNFSKFKKKELQKEFQVYGPKLKKSEDEIMSPLPKKIRWEEEAEFDQCEYEISKLGENKVNITISPPKSPRKFYSKSVYEEESKNFEINFLEGSEFLERRLEEDINESDDEATERNFDNKSLLTRLLKDENEGLKEVGIQKFEGGEN